MSPVLWHGLCCQISIAPNLTSLNITFDGEYMYSNSEVQDFNPCSYAFVAEQDWFRFDASYLDGIKFEEKIKDVLVPTVRLLEINHVM
jgi:hypothetical protein